MPDLEDVLRELTEPMHEVFRWASARPDGDVRVFPYRDAGRMVRLGLVERRTWCTNHALRRPKAGYFLTDFGDLVRARLLSSCGEGSDA